MMRKYRIVKVDGLWFPTKDAGIIANAEEVYEWFYSDYFTALKKATDLNSVHFL